nr:immunoglobulin heavy chain junction region [Mus musculus]
CTRHRVYFDYW